MALEGAAKRSDTSGRGYLSFRVMELSHRKSTHNWRDLSFFLTMMSILELCCRSPAILQFTVLADSTNYTDHSCSPILYFGDLYHRILLDYPIPTHFESRISDQNCQRYGTSPFSSVKESYFMSSRRSQEQYLLDNRSYGDLVLPCIPIKTNPVAFQ